MKANNLPTLHNAAWPGVVGKGSPGAEPFIDLLQMMDLTAAATGPNGEKFDGIDLFLSDPHISIDSSEDDLKRWADEARSRNLVFGSVVAPVWTPAGGGPAIDTGEGRQRFLTQVEKGCRIANFMRKIGIRPYGVVRLDTACGPADWLKNPIANQRNAAKTLALACDIAEDFGERIAGEGEICWGGMHSLECMVDLLERVDRPHTFGFQADMAHTLLYLLSPNDPKNALLPANFDWSDTATLDAAYELVVGGLAPWTIDFHVAQNDGTIHGSGTHDKTGRHCLPKDPKGKLDIPRRAVQWFKKMRRVPDHLCWDGCMFPNYMLRNPQTWNDILAVMVETRNAWAAA